jgi:LmbE family N-acetylglucosaminyl deacetylase
MTRADRRTSPPARLGAGALTAALASLLVAGGSIVAAGAMGIWPIGATASVAAPSPSPTDPVSPRRSSSPVASPTPAATPTPISPAAETCDGDTVLTVWAHPDDDIIFANPTISNALAAGECVRSLFVTAGDAGRGLGYAKEREQGILNAYDHMRGAVGAWDSSLVTLDAGLRVERRTPQGDPRVSVLFAHLPDGNITDGGFDATGHQTLSKLLDGGIGTISPIDGGPAVDRSHLSAALAEFAAALHPVRTLTHVPRGSAYASGDHPDHSVVGTLVRDSIGHDAAAAPGILYFIGYPSQDLPRTLDGAILDAKVETYRLYSQHDDVVRCADRDACLKTRRFGEWLRRSYPLTEADLRLS